MSAVVALTPSLTLLDNRTGSSSGQGNEDPAAFANVLQTLSARTETSAKSGSAPSPSTASAGGASPSRSDKAGIKSFSNGAAKDEEASLPSKPIPSADQQNAASSNDPNGLTLAALVQAAVASAPQPAPVVDPPQAQIAVASAPQPAPAASPQGRSGAAQRPSQNTSSSDAADAAAPTVADPSNTDQPAVTVAASATAPAPAGKILSPASASPVRTSAPTSRGPSAPDQGSAPPDAPAPASAVPDRDASTGVQTTGPDGSQSAAAVAAATILPQAPASAPILRSAPNAYSARPAAAGAGPATGTPGPSGVSAGGSASSSVTTDGASVQPSKLPKSEPVEAAPVTGPTPFADPATGGSAAAQVAGALATLGQGRSPATADPAAIASAGSGVPGASTASSSAAGSSPSGASQTGPREMVIQLDPEHLGTVSIKMRMVDGKLDIDIRVANAQTLDLLSKDRHVLSAAVEAAGGASDNFLLRSATDQSSTTSPGQDLTGSGAGTDPGRQQASSSAASFGEGSRRHAASADTAASDMTRDDDNAPVPNAVSRGLDGSLYV